jgi:hypothetical protein
VRFPLQSVRSSCSHISCHNYKRASFWISLNRIGISYAIEASLDLMWTAHKTSITPSLEVQRVVDWNAPAFKLLSEIEWYRTSFDDARASMTQVVESSLASPVEVRPDGQSLLEVSTVLIFRTFFSLTFLQRLLNFPWANGEIQLKLLEFLVHSGANLNTTGYRPINLYLLTILIRIWQDLTSLFKLERRRSLEERL